MLRDGYVASGTISELVALRASCTTAGARNVLVSRASEPAVLSTTPNRRPSSKLAGPVFEALDHSGAGDSMFAATGVGLARGMSMIEALRLGMAAGALNATRRGLGTGTRTGDRASRQACDRTSACATAAASIDAPAWPGLNGAGVDARPARCRLGGYLRRQPASRLRPADLGRPGLLQPRLRPAGGATGPRRCARRGRGAPRPRQRRPTIAPASLARPRRQPRPRPEDLERKPPAHRRRHRPGALSPVPSGQLFTAAV